MHQLMQLQQLWLQQLQLQKSHQDHELHRIIPCVVVQMEIDVIINFKFDQNAQKSAELQTPSLKFFFQTRAFCNTNWPGFIYFNL